MSKRSEAKKVSKYRKEMRRVTDAALRVAKSELERELLSANNKKKLIALEKRIEAIEDIQASRGIFAEVLKPTAKATGRKVLRAAMAAEKQERKDALAAAEHEKELQKKAAKAAKRAAAKAARNEKRAAAKEQAQ
ncbi:MAG: hypothetical protein IJH91_07290 [Mogibacterium sp.]|nr:hypothetical protein [Mogibacterium sp.]